MEKRILKLVKDYLENEWNLYGNANLKYTIEDKNRYLYLQNTKLCKLKDIVKVQQQYDTMILNLKDKTSVYVVIQWVHPKDAFISQMYIHRDSIGEEDIILYDI